MPLSINNITRPMPTDELISQAGKRLVVGINGEWPEPAEVDFLNEARPGGLILFARNIRDYGKVRELIAFVREQCGSPFIVAVDQEGGPVARFVHGVAQCPSQMGLAATGKKQLCSKLASRVGADLRSMGIDLNLAPVLDINACPDNPGIGCRAFSDETLTVSEYGSALIRGYHKGGVAACAKHFPGKGRAWLDAHVHLPLIDRGMLEMMSEELVPFKQAIKSGVNFIMTSHVIVPWLSGDFPVTLVDYALSALLRHRMKYEGIILTDDLLMGALQSFDYSRVIKASACSHDVLLVCSDLDKQKEAFKHLKEGLASGDISLITATKSLKRIQKYFGWASQLSSRESGDGSLEYRMALAACTKVRDMDRLLPVQGEVLTICTDFMALTKVEDREGSVDYLRDMLREHGITGPFIKTPASPDDELIDQIAVKAAEAKKCLIVTANAHLLGQQERLVKRVIDSQPETVSVAVRNPYDLDCFKDSPTVLMTFGFRKPSLKALARILSGNDKPKGHLPVDI